MKLTKATSQRMIAEEVVDLTTMLLGETNMEEERFSTTSLNSKIRVSTLREKLRLMPGT